MAQKRLTFVCAYFVIPLHIFVFAKFDTVLVAIFRRFIRSPVAVHSTHTFFARGTVGPFVRAFGCNVVAPDPGVFLHIVHDMDFQPAL